MFQFCFFMTCFSVYFRMFLIFNEKSGIVQVFWLVNCKTYLWANSSLSCAALRSIAASSSSHCVSLEDTIAARAKEAHDVHAERHRGLHKRRDSGSIWLNFMVGVRFRDLTCFRGKGCFGGA